MGAQTRSLWPVRTLLVPYQCQRTRQVYCAYRACMCQSKPLGVSTKCVIAGPYAGSSESSGCVVVRLALPGAEAKEVLRGPKNEGQRTLTLGTLSTQRLPRRSSQCGGLGTVVGLSVVYKVRATTVVAAGRRPCPSHGVRHFPVRHAAPGANEAASMSLRSPCLFRQQRALTYLSPGPLR